MKDIKSFIKFSGPIILNTVCAAITAWIFSNIMPMTPVEIVTMAMALLAGFIAMDLYAKSANYYIR